MTHIKKTRKKGPYTQADFDEFAQSIKVIQDEYAATDRVDPKPFDLNHWQSKWGDEELPLV